MAAPTGNSGFEPALIKQQMQLMMQMQQQMADMQQKINAQDTTIQALTQAGPSAQQKSSLLSAQLNTVSEEERELRNRINSLQTSITLCSAERESIPKRPGDKSSKYQAVPRDEPRHNALTTQISMESKQLEEAKKMLAELSKKRADIEFQIKTFTQ